MIRPLKAAKKLKSITFDAWLSQIRFPNLATPKIDGIRCRTLKEAEIQGAYTNSGKHIANQYVFTRVSTEVPSFLDGELTCGKNFQAVTSGIMTHSGQPNFTYFIFDSQINQPNTPYYKRVEHYQSLTLPNYCVKLAPNLCSNLIELLQFEKECLDNGAEGVMIRSPNALYKYGRSTIREHYLVAIKRFEDGEAQIIGFEELMHNENIATIDINGLTKRASNQENLIPSGILGAFIVKDLEDGIVFKIGASIKQEEKEHIFTHKSDFLNKIIRYKYQEHGTKNKPRIPIFDGFRDREDL